MAIALESGFHGLGWVWGVGGAAAFHGQKPRCSNRQACLMTSKEPHLVVDSESCRDFSLKSSAE